MSFKIVVAVAACTVICMTVIFPIGTDACEMDQMQFGCRIDNGACTCAFGCRAEFRYSTRKDCQDALKGRASDTCGRAPCLNGGHCIQISKSPNYICHCEGTGYWGNRCQRECPTVDANSQHQLDPAYLHQCISI